MAKNGSTFFDKANSWIKSSITLKLVTIGILILLMLIPVNMVQDLIREREYGQQEAIEEVSSKWGNAQVISGPVLTVPYNSYARVYDNDEKSQYTLVQLAE